MPKSKPLTDKQILAIRPTEKRRQYFDGGGLYLLVAPSGGKSVGKWWRLKYYFEGKVNHLSLGTYPATSLKEARIRRDEARVQLARGIDPKVKRKATKQTKQGGPDSFEQIAREWHTKKTTNLSPGHRAHKLHALEKDAFPFIGSTPIARLGAPELLDVLRRVEERGAVESAHRLRAMLGEVFRYAIATGRIGRDPSADLKGALPPVRATNLAALTDPAKVGALLRDCDKLEGSFVVRSALQLAPLLAVRPGELRKAEWSEFNLDGDATWIIPGSKMKSRRDHVVPLSRQALAILTELRRLTGLGQYVFPSFRTATQPMSNGAILAALRRLGYEKHEQSGHGFRSVFSTIANESGLWDSDLIELTLAHQIGTEVSRAYNRANRLNERRKLMDWWGNKLDELRGVVLREVAAG